MSKDPSLGKQIQKSYFISLLKEHASVRSDVAELNGDLGERLKSAQEGSNLHLKAFRTIAQMSRMEEQKRNAYWDCLQLYHDFAQEELWGGQHVGDLDKMARATSVEDEPPSQGEAINDDPAKHAEGIKQLDPEKHEANQKGKRGRAKAAAQKAQAEDDDLDSAEAEGLADWHARKPGAIPEKYADKPAAGQRWLDGWERGQIQASKDRDAADFDKNPPRTALPGADAPGSYVAH